MLTGTEGSYTLREFLKQDDAAFTPATDAVLMIGAEFDDTAPDSVDEGDAGALRMSSRRELYTQLRDAAGNERGANVNASNQLAVAGPVTNAGTFAVQVDGDALTALQLIDNIVQAEDVASAGGHSGAVVLARRTDTPANQSGTDGDYEFLQVAGGRLWVDPSGVTLTVASHAVTNAGTFAVQVDGSALTALQLIDDPVFADDAAFTLATSKVMMAGAIRDDALSALTPVEADAVPLRVDANGALWVIPSGTVAVSLASVPSHAVTNAGTFAVQVDGAALTALQLIDNLVLLEDVAHVTGDPGIQMLAVRDDTLNIRSGAENDYEPLHTNADGALWVLDVNSAAIKTAVETLDNAISGTEMQVDVVAALPAGTNAIGKLAANSGVDIGDVDVLSIAAGANLIGDVGIGVRTSGGVSTMNATSSDGGTALTNTAQVIKASAGQLYGWAIYNPNAVAAFVQIYNTAAASVTVGTTNPLFMLTIPPGAAAHVLSPIGILFSNAGYSWAATSTAGGNGALTTALDAVAWYN